MLGDIWEEEHLGEPIHHCRVSFRCLILDDLKLRSAAGIPCCAAGIKVEILHPLHLDVCWQPSAPRLATCW
jgi:hypothetical protein